MTNRKPLSKTEQKILESARNNRHGIVSVHTGFFIGSRRPAYGSRDHDACLSLKERGLIEFVSQNKGVHHFAGNRSADHYTEHTFRLKA